MTVKLLHGDCRQVLKTLESESVHCVITSPPYYALRSYLPADHPSKHLEIGSEPTLQDWVRTMVEVFREVRRVLRDDGVVFLNLGDAYAGSRQGPQGLTSPLAACGHQGGGAKRLAVPRPMTASARRDNEPIPRSDVAVSGLKKKDLMGQPWRVAFALQDDGWWLRQEVIWCLSGGAWVYARTQKGDMPVMLKDLVRLNPGTVKLWNGQAWTQVLGWGPSNDTTQRLELVLRSGERIGCTGGHLWPTQRGNVAARDLAVGDVIQTCRLPESGSDTPAYLTGDMLWLLGLYLAEGSRADDTIQLALHADEVPWLPRIKAAAAALGATITSTVKGNCLNVRLYGRVLAAAVEEHIGGATASDKHLRAVVWRLPDSALRLIVEGYLDGDGHRDEGNERHRLGFARNYSLERDLRALAARLGATLTLKPTQSKYQHGVRPAFRGEWRWERSGHHNEKDRGEVVEIRASRARRFWDVAVEDEPHLFALASGVLTHNCKKNPMPESTRDRFTKAHEHIFILTKSERYYWDFAAVQEPVGGQAHARRASNGVGFGHGFDADARKRGRQQWKTPDGWDTRAGAGGHGSFHKDGREKGKYGALTGQDTDGALRTKAGLNLRASTPKADLATSGNDGAYADGKSESLGRGPGWRVKNNASVDEALASMPTMRNPRDVFSCDEDEFAQFLAWKASQPVAPDVIALATHPFKGAHFATYPPELIRPFIRAGCPLGGTVLDPFGGSGTTGLVANQEGRNAVLIDLDARCMPMAVDRISEDGPLFADVSVEAA